jgi:hypothetical protein
MRCQCVGANVSPMRGMLSPATTPSSQRCCPNDVENGGLLGFTDSNLLMAALSRVRCLR